MDKEVDLYIEKHFNIYLCFKRVFDIFVSLIGIIFIIPISLFIKIIYVLNKDYDSIFYSQDRIGKNGKIFKLYKFRTMVSNADEVLEELLKTSEYKLEWEKNQKFEHDPRITKIGKILRKTSLDELPQFINILKGDMSLIGPRPLVPGELDAHDGNHEIYESVTPGLTSWWACNGRSDTSYEERLNLEYYYCQNISFILDLKIVFKTIYAVIFSKGAK